MRHKIIAVAVVALLPLTAGLAAAGADDGGYEQVVDLTFPVSGPSSYGHDYHAARGGGTRRHQATDIFAAKLQHVHAAVGGEVIRITGIDEPMPSWGYQIVIRGDDGLEYGYVHLNNDSPGTDDGLGGPGLAYAPGIRKGVRVERGQWIAFVGDSGNAETTPPHLHFEITDPELVDERIGADPYKQGRIDPYYSLEAARLRGDVGDPPTGPGADPTLRVPPEARRVAGPTRVHTAVALSGQRSAARTVVVAPAAEHANALVAAPLAGLLDAPILLTAASRLEEAVAAEVTRLGAVNAYVVGSVDELATAVEDGLRAAGVVNLARIGGADRYEIAAEVAREMLSYPFVDGFDEVLVALGESDVPSRAWPDALSASTLAAHLEVPILLVRPGSVPEPVAAVLADLRPAVVRVVGGTAAVGAEVAEAASAAAGGADVERLAGATRYETSVAVADAAVEAGLDASAVWLATGHNFPDALAAGPAAARAGSPLVLVDGLRVGGAPGAESWLAAGAGHIDHMTLVGGTGVILPAVATALGNLMAR